MSSFIMIMIPGDVPISSLTGLATFMSGKLTIWFLGVHSSVSLFIRVLPSQRCGVLVDPTTSQFRVACYNVGPLDYSTPLKGESAELWSPPTGLGL